MGDARDAGGARDEALQTMLLALCLDPGADDEFRRDPAAFARRFAVDERDARALLADGKRLPLYRRLVRCALGGTVRDVLGPFVTRLEADAPGAFSACLDTFLASGPPASRLREVPRAFLHASQARLSADPRVAPWLLEAADAILAEHDVGAAPDAPAGASGESELALDCGLSFAPAVALRRYDFAVPLIDLDDLDPSAGAPPHRPATWLLVRDRDDATAWRELSPAVAAFVTRALAGDTLATATAAALAVASSGAVVIERELTQLLTGLASDGALVGGRLWSQGP